MESKRRGVELVLMCNILVKILLFRRQLVESCSCFSVILRL